MKFLFILAILSPGSLVGNLTEIYLIFIFFTFYFSVFTFSLIFFAYDSNTILEYYKKPVLMIISKQIRRVSNVIPQKSADYSKHSLSLQKRFFSTLDDYFKKKSKKMSEKRLDVEREESVLRDVTIRNYKVMLTAKWKLKCQQYFIDTYLQNVTNPNTERFRAVIRAIVYEGTEGQPNGRLYLGWHLNHAVLSPRTIPCFRELISILIDYEMPEVVMDIFVDEFTNVVRIDDYRSFDLDANSVPYHAIKLDKNYGYYISNLVLTERMYKAIAYYRNQSGDLYSLSLKSREHKEIFIWLMQMKDAVKAELIDPYGFKQRSSF